MKTEHHYRWRFQWFGKWKTTSYHCTEESIRVEHPEAQVVPGTLIVRQVPETEAEMQQRIADICMGQVATPAPGMGPKG